MVYPGATPEIRILVKQDGTQSLQVRYVNITQGYVGKWHDAPVVIEEEKQSTNKELA
jgi:hypothetical protein